MMVEDKSHVGLDIVCIVIVVVVALGCLTVREGITNCCCEMDLVRRNSVLFFLIFYCYCDRLWLPFQSRGGNGGDMFLHGI